MKVWHLHGTPYEMGVHMAKVARAALIEVCSDYPLRVILQFIDHDQPKTLDALRPFADKYYALMERKYMPRAPAWVRQELMGMANQAAHPQVTITRLFAINYGPDVLLSLLYSPEDMKRLFGNVDLPFKVPDMCNTRMQGPFFVRDYQMANGGAFDRLCGLVVRHVPGKKVTACVAPPGYLGGVSVTNCCSLSMGVNLLRSSAANMDHVELPASILMRVACENYTKVCDVSRFLREQRHGTPWMYSAHDRHDAAVFECVAYGSDTVYERRHGTRSPGEVIVTGYRQEKFLKKTYGVFPYDLQEIPELVVTNMPLHPSVRETQYDPWIAYLEKKCAVPVYRYLVMASLPLRTLPEALELAEFLNPTTGYPNGPVIEGALTVVHNGWIYWKVGPWTSEWKRFHIAAEKDE